jgi:hypothetical protein
MNVQQYTAVTPTRPVRDVLSNITNTVVQSPPIRRHSTPLKEKKRVVEAVSAATEEQRPLVMTSLGVDARTVERWNKTIKTNSDLPRGQKRPQTAKRLRGGGRKRDLDTDQEDALDDWVVKKRQLRLAVSELDIQRRAREEYKINAGQKWVQDFMRRRRFSMRLATTNKEVNTEKMKLLKFHWCNRHAELFLNTSGSLLFNLDETSVYLDQPAARTVERIGAVSVEIATTKHELDRVAVVLCYSRAGDLVYALVMHTCKEKTQLVKTHRLDRTVVHTAQGDVVLFVTHNRKAWLNGTLMVKSLLDIYKPAVEAAGHKLEDCILFMDNCGAHDSAEVMAAMKEADIRYAFFPPNTTPILQPCDQNINQLFKQVYGQQWALWYEKVGRHQQTKYGNPRKATEAEVNGWIAHAIKAITPAVVRASWERSAVAEYNAFHLPDAPWEALLSYFDEKDDKLTVLKAARAEYETSRSFIFPVKQRRGKAAASSDAAAASVTVAAAAASVAPAPPSPDSMSAPCTQRVQLYRTAPQENEPALPFSSMVQPAPRRLHHMFIR